MIHNCWRHTEILPVEENVEENVVENDLLLEELSNVLETLNFPDGMQAEELLALSEEDITYEVSEDDNIIAELVDMFKKKSNKNLDEDDYNVVEIRIH